MRNRFRQNPCGCLAALIILSTWTLSSAASRLEVKPADSLSSLRERLTADPGIREVVFAGGTYIGGLYVEGKKDTDFADRPLLLRAADGAEVIFDGARPVEKFQPDENLPGVFSIEYTSEGGEYPKLWEPNRRVRYRLVADRQSVAQFPASFSIEGKRLLFHTSDGQAPRSGELRMSEHDLSIVRMSLCAASASAISSRGKNGAPRSI